MTDKKESPPRGEEKWEKSEGLRPCDRRKNRMGFGFLALPGAEDTAQQHQFANVIAVVVRGQQDLSQ